MSFAVVCTNLSFAWPDGTPVLTGLNAAFSSGRTGLIGSNGAGKSTLLKLVAGTLVPKAGTITVSGDVGYLPQDLPLATKATVADLLGISATLRAVAAIEAWPGVMVIVSHDRELLERVDQIAELYDGALRTYGGTISAYEAQVAAEREAAERAVGNAAAAVKREHRDLVASQVKQARRDRHGRQVAASGSVPRIVAHARKRKAQESAGASRESDSAATARISQPVRSRAENGSAPFSRPCC